MNCEICGRGNCTRSFHSIEEQDNFDNIADNIKERTKAILCKRIERIGGHYHGDNYYVNVDTVIEIINNYY